MNEPTYPMTLEEQIQKAIKDYMSGLELRVFASRDCDTRVEIEVRLSHGDTVICEDRDTFWLPDN